MLYIHRIAFSVIVSNQSLTCYSLHFLYKNFTNSYILYLFYYIKINLTPYFFVLFIFEKVNGILVSISNRSVCKLKDKEIIYIIETTLKEK